jgi:hypothetical protein
MPSRTKLLSHYAKPEIGDLYENQDPRVSAKLSLFATSIVLWTIIVAAILRF